MSNFGNITYLPNCYCSVTKLCLTLCNPTNCSIPGFSVHHYLPEFAQAHIHWVCYAIQPPCPLSPPSPAFNLSQHQGPFHWVGSSHQMAKVLGLQLQNPMNIQCWFILGLTSLTSLVSKVLSRVFSSTTVQKHQFFSSQPSLWYNSHIHTWLLEKP